MAIGKIATLRADKGFGFIKVTPGPKGNNDIFFHRSAVVGTSFEELREGQEVSFDSGPDPRDSSRMRASNVTPISGFESSGDEFDTAEG